jgi:hypothetical protein
MIGGGGALLTQSTPVPPSAYTDLPTALNTSNAGVMPPQERPRHGCVVTLEAVTSTLTGAPAG